ncbi:MAG TPA: hypothetical protein VJP76_01245 [Candidatus Tumulicola sp.]|nr:hypothetical protein [Candidatus Tumulicola sp.]
MYLPPPGRPSFWKALLCSALVVLPLSLLPRLAFRWSDWAWLGTVAIAAVVVAVLVHLRLSANWLDQDSQRISQWEERTRIAPDPRGE